MITVTITVCKSRNRRTNEHTTYPDSNNEHSTKKNVGCWIAKNGKPIKKFTNHILHADRIFRFKFVSYAREFKHMDKKGTEIGKRVAYVFFQQMFILTICLFFFKRI
jgi:hypothetical protein